ncbi:MAG: hypothetical protein KatS3mg108_2385 [Isosphaeraceae bacterium]|nr:MAG: hypothetical protein KatS3mg108_2385 [Isosphaeraceae bacterium]
MGILGFGRTVDKYLVVVSYEGGGRMRLNGIRVRDKKTKQNASNHTQTVCWSEFDADGVRTDQGKGSEAKRLEPETLEKLLRELPMIAECRFILERLRAGEERVGKWLAWGSAGAPKRGTVGSQGKS